MRKSNWKVKLLVVLAYIVGLGLGFVISFNLPVEYHAYRGLVLFGTLAVVSSVIVIIGIKLFHIGRR